MSAKADENLMCPDYWTCIMAVLLKKEVILCFIRLNCLPAPEGLH